MLLRTIFFMVSAWAVVSVLMTILWWIGKRSGNYSIVDVGWGLCISAAAVVYYNLSDGYPLRSAWITALVAIWGWRLSLFILVTRAFSGHEDPRYTAFRAEYGDQVDRKFFVNVFQLQGILAVLLSLPFVFPNLNDNPNDNPFETAGILLFVLSLLGESIADFQLNEFRKKTENKGKVCDVGLWRYSRHPNYFFEWLIWVAFGIYSLGSPYGWLGLLSPIAMFVLLTKVTGIPLNEVGQLKSKGELYREYARKTNAFFPWFPKKV
ncbi:DUF1295 domain-containing protein [Leptospira gomenensis]|uniref:DUF1295 domain-containing protein n=1 Tax=Leptospira gomenensis TaxID=2484974 RepID=A0A5F1YQD2_9LEPT|nr:DUF1295 domain-containing protein [Leptospira gomenensis]TGK32592.1 DUF1295 domain-containing protein [Leptospira gomenensis]TGK38323.1 DUF1295 domain-containing protein [Leptospira gomenensis]TGK52137.1 DUF1295 domain-containing protein [Leptospira gomenensis]TGK59814.1 DUF1295 domain-containing protein [Leptospira gomenensis]